MAPLPADTAIRRRVAELIDSDERSQAKLAADSGVSQKTLSGIVTGYRADLRAEVVARVARACGLSPADLGRLLYECFPEKTSERT